jgi:hypothetical protein
MYKLRPVVKYSKKGRRKYKNLAAFNRECSKHGSGGNSCFLYNIRCLKDGGGLATVKTIYPGGDERIFHRGGKPSGTWRLHFASCKVMKAHLRGRVNYTSAATLDGSRRRKR